MKKQLFFWITVLFLTSCTQNKNAGAETSDVKTNEDSAFKGSVSLDIRDSKPDWNAFLYKKAPKGAPNVLVILYDDTGQATWSTYGGRVNMPTLDRLAKNGLTYTQWHTTSVCSPTRSTMLTGRNHHQNGFGSISESAVGFPGYSGHIPESNATIGTILRNAWWKTITLSNNLTCLSKVTTAQKI